MLKSKGVRVFAAIAVALLLSAAYLRQGFVLPVLMYHSVQPAVAPGNRLAVSTRTFDRQMAFLSCNGYKVLPLERAAAIYGKKKPARTLAITFDDGYEDNFTFAFPVLLKYRIPATIFLIYGKIGTPGYLSWEQVARMQESGLISFGSHSLNHLDLTKLASGEELEREISGSKSLLEEKLGREVKLFSYPMGRYDQRVSVETQSAGYLCAAATNPGKKETNDDIFAIKRLRISENAGNLFVFWIETSGYYNLIREKRHK